MDSSKILTGVGVIAMSYATLRFLRFVYLYARASSLKKYRYGNEPWALVTGASGEYLTMLFAPLQPLQPI